MLAIFSPAPHTLAEPPAPAPIVSLSHAQLAWSYALEWCESNGIPSAINPKDSDGTPSYGAFQFKPQSFIYFAGIFDVATSSGLMSYGDQRAILTAMLEHSGQIEWAKQFPACVKKLGLPPP